MPDVITAGAPRDADIARLTDHQIEALVDATMVTAQRPGLQRPRWVMPVAAAAVGLTVLGLSAFGPGAAPAWSAVPHAVSATDLAAAEHECQAFFNEKSNAAVVAAEARGGSVFIILDDTSQCLWAFGASMGGTNRDPGPATGDQVRVVTNNEAGGVVDNDDLQLDGNPKPGTGQWVWSVSGRVGPEVQSIVVHRDGAEDVVATVQNGWFMAWWPSQNAGTSLTVTSGGVTREEPLPAP